MFKDVWDMRLREAQNAKETLEGQLRDVERQIDSYLERIVEASNASVIKAYETKIEKLARQKIRLSDQAENIVPPEGYQNTFIEPAMEFLSNPWNI